MSKNENKRLMREKNDTCIKSYQLANTMFLNGEEFAAVIRKAMIVDDVNNKRYIDIDYDLKSTYQSYEKKWLDEFDMLAKKNPLVLQAYLSIRGQTKKSRQSFNDLQDYLTEKTAQEEDKKPSHEVSVPEKKNLGVNKGAYWLHGSDYETEDEEALLVDEIMNNYNWREDEDLLADYKSGEFFKSVKVSNISREITAFNVVAEYMKSFYER